jgi:hypothetical protein
MADRRCLLLWTVVQEFDSPTLTLGWLLVHLQQALGHPLAAPQEELQLIKAKVASQQVHLTELLSPHAS